MSINKTTLVESLGDGDLATLALATSSERYSSSDFETLEDIQAELECMNAEEVITSQEEEAETIIPDIEMTDLSTSEVQSEQIVYTTANQNNQNVIFQTKPTLQRVPVSAMQMKSTSSTQPTQSQSIMIVSPVSGQGASQILKISHPASASPGQLQSIAQTLIGAKADGSIVQLRTAQPNKPVTVSQSANIGLSNVHTIKNTTTAKRPAQSNQQRNVYTKMILTGNQSQSGGQMLLATTQGDNQAIKIVGNNVTNQGIASPTKTITLAQAQQMGLLSTNKGLIVNKLIQTSTSQPSKVTLVPTNAVKSPMKILPAPTLTTQVKPTVSNSQQTSVNKTQTIQQSPQKVIIRQSPIKTGAVFGGGQVIRIPANQSIVSGSNTVHQMQIPRRQVQYVRLMSTAGTGTTNVVTVGKPKTQTIQTGGTHKVSTQPQQIVKVVPLNTGNQTLRNVAPKSQTLAGTSQRIIIPASSTGSGQNKNSVTIPASALSQLASGQAVLSTGPNVGNIVVLPAQYIQQQQQSTVKKIITDDVKSKLQVTPTLLNTSLQTSQTSSLSSLEPKSSKSYNNVEPNGIRPRKPCNCTKSQCLKLYCDCFANGEFCHMCNCNNCSNNLGNEEERQRAIKSCLERNPNAFRPKIGKGKDTGEDIRRHNKGCNCKRSGCLKNYCECYEAKIPCSQNCKCVGCRNVEDLALSKKSLKDLAEAAEARTAQLSLNKAKLQHFSEMAFRPPATSNTGPRQPFNFLTDKVVEMTCQCLMAQAEEAERNMLDEDKSQKLIIEEFGRCLKEIIESAHKAEAT